MEVVLDILMIIIASLWTIIMVTFQIVSLSQWSRYYLPLEATGKILNTLANFLLLTCIWLNTFRLVPWFSWTIMLVAFILLLIWWRISKLQQNYLKEKIEKIKRQHEEELKKLNSYSAVITEKKKRRRK